MRTSYFMQNSTTTVKRGPTAARWRAIATVAVGALSLNGCLGLQVDNPNTLNLDNLYVSAANTEAALVGGWRRYYGMVHGVNTSNAAANCGGGVYAAWGNAVTIINSTTFLEGTQEPRVPIDNVNNLQCANRGPWYDGYSAIASGREGYQAIVNNKLTYGTVNATFPEGQDTPMRKIFAKFIVAISQTTVGLRFDQAVITDMSFVPSATPPLSPYKAVLTDAIAKFREVIADSRATADFTFPTTWINTRAITRDELIRICQTYITRAEVYGARSVAERDAVNWAGVLARLDSGIVRDFAQQADPVIGAIIRSPWVDLSYNTSSPRISPRMLGPADTSGQYQIWASAPIATRTQITITTPDRRIHGAAGNTTAGTRFALQTGNQTNAANAPWLASRYASTRYKNTANDSGNKALILMATVQEQGFIKAEALYRLGRGTEAAAIINPTRIAAGLKAVDANGPPAGRDCVPKKVDGSCGNLFDAIKYEKFIELYPAEADLFWYDSRGWGTMVPGTPIHVPVSGRDLVTMGLPIYTFGGVGNPGSSP